MTTHPPLPTGSVTANLNLAQRGDGQAFEWLWQRYYPMLVRQVQRLTRGSNSQSVDPDEVAHSVFIALHKGITQETFHSLRGRYQLWKLLTILGTRKASNRAKKAAIYRKHLLQNMLARQSVIDTQDGLFDVTGKLEESFESLLIQEELEHGLALLDKEDPKHRLRELVTLKFNGHSNERIAEILSWSRKTVALRLNLIFEIWKEASGA